MIAQCVDEADLGDERDTSARSPSSDDRYEPDVTPIKTPRRELAEGADATADETPLRHFWRAITSEGEVREVRIPKARRGPARLFGTVSGYFNDENRFVEAVRRISGKDAEGVYITLNAVKPDLLARAANRLENMAKATTSDADIVRRSHLLIDVDPRRAAGISATESERMAAVETRDLIESFLRDLWGTDPLYSAMSGNGGGLVYRIDLPNDPDGLALVSAVLKALAAQFDSDTVAIDQSVANAARITKVIGTIAAKGDDTPSLDRRWRRATATFPPAPRVVTREQLQTLVGLATPQLVRADEAKEPIEDDDIIKVCNQGARSWTVSDLLERHDIAFRQVKKEYGTVYELDCCLTSTDHDDGAAIVELANGALAYRCHHNACSGRTWADARAALGLSAPEADAPSSAELWEREDGEQAKGAKSAEGTGRASGAIQEVAETATTLADFAPVARRLLNGKLFRFLKDQLADTVAGWAIGHERLLIADEGDALKPAVFLVDDDGAVLPLDGTLPRVKSALARVGINAAEPMYAWMVNRLQTSAVNDGARRVKLERYVARRGARLFISNGPTRIVVADAGRPLRTVSNGFDGILFTADAVLPPWDPDATPVDPLTLAVLQPNLEPPSEVPEYSAEAQRLLLRGLLVALMAGLRPIPSIVALGGSDGGKTTLSRGITRLVLGGTGDVCDSQVDARDFASLVSSRPLVAIDNLDAAPPPWLHDAIATAVTGGQIQRRELYTNATIVAKPITACLLITSRTAAFANRADIMERLCPLFVTSPTRRMPESELFGELAAARDGALVWLATMAAEALARTTEAPDRLPGRFVDWARIVWALDPEHGPSALEAMARAQQLAITDPDPLAAKIVAYLRESATLEGVPKAIVETVDPYRELDYLGGGKAIARRLRELAKGFLPKAGILVTSRMSGNDRIWLLQRVDPPAGAEHGGETEKTEENLFLSPLCLSPQGVGAQEDHDHTRAGEPISPLDSLNLCRAALDGSRPPSPPSLASAPDERRRDQSEPGQAPPSTVVELRPCETEETTTLVTDLEKQVEDVIWRGPYAVYEAKIAAALGRQVSEVQPALAALEARGLAYHEDCKEGRLYYPHLALATDVS